MLCGEHGLVGWTGCNQPLAGVCIRPSQEEKARLTLPPLMLMLSDPLP